MNKYQKRAVLEILGLMIVAALVGFTMSVVAQYLTAQHLVIGLGMIAMAFCFYIVFQIRVDQLKSEDRK